MQSVLAHVKYVAPGAGPFLIQGNNLNKLYGGPIGDATYQISKLYALWFREDF